MAVQRGGSVAGRRSRRPRAELEQLLLAAGRELIASEGLSLGVEEVTFKRLFDHLETSVGVRVTHASVIGRIWANQAEFQLALLTSVLEQHVTEDPSLEDSLRRIAKVLDEADLGSEASRWAALEEICRVGSEDNLALLQADTWWPLWVSVWAWIATHEGPGRDQLAETLRRNYRDGDGAFAFLYEVVMDRLGFRLVEGISIEQFSAMLSTAAEGAAVRQRIDPEAVACATRDGAPWTTLGLSFKALSRYAMEPIPGWSAPQGQRG